MIFEKFRRVDVSMIVTTYKSQQYLARCLQSIADQTFIKQGGRVEVLCIDDGSNDGTVELAQELLQQNRLQGAVYSHENTGSPSKSRNRGIELARGKYIFFMDVDDYLGPQALERMYALAMVKSAEVCVGKYVGVGRGVPKVMFKETTPDTSIMRTPLIDSLNVLKMYRRDFVLHEMRYRFNSRIKIAEDHPFALEAYVRAKNVAVVGDTDCYFCVYNKPQNSDDAKHLTGRMHGLDTYYDYYWEVFELLEKLRAEYPEKVEYTIWRYWNRLLTLDYVYEARRGRSEADQRRSYDMFMEVCNRFGMWDAQKLDRRALAMQHALRLGDLKMIELLAKTY